MKLRSVQMKWRRATEYTRWRVRIDRGVDHTSYHFGTLHLTIQKEA